MLENLGYEVTVKTSSKETLDVFSQCPDEFDLLMTDQIMPEMTGTELISNVRSIRPDIPVILTSGFSEVITKEKGDEIGISGYVRKPYVLRDLGMTIRQVFEEAQGES